LCALIRGEVFTLTTKGVARPSIRICEKLPVYCRKFHDEAGKVVENLELYVDAIRDAIIIICGQDDGGSVESNKAERQ
jgi:hypothetical protein